MRSESAKPAPQSAGTHALPYPVDVRPRDLAAESLPEGGDVAAFDTAAAIAINNARLDHLDGLGLPIAGRSVLDVGGGPGHLAQYFVRAGCPVLSTDARPENVARARELYPELATGVLDIEADGFAADETYEVVFCYGLLYHVENPLLVLRRLAALTRDLLLLETVITDSVLPLVRVDDETTSFNQALHGIGSAPEPQLRGARPQQSGVRSRLRVRRAAGAPRLPVRVARRSRVLARRPPPSLRVRRITRGAGA